MNLRLTLYALASGHALDAPATRRLFETAGLSDEPLAVRRRLWPAVAVIAAALTGLGVILWLAANWDTLGRAGRFALLQVVILVFCAGAALRPRLAPALGLLALLGTGGLFAYFGQTYQTGADPWQLFALWAVLTLPLALAVRSDAVWVPWTLVVMTGISLWVQAHTGHRWRMEPGDQGVFLAAWLAMALVVAALSPAAWRFTGAGAWAMRTAATLAVIAITLTALGGLFTRNVASFYWLGLAVLGIAAAVLTLPRVFDVFVISAVALGLDSLLIIGTGRLLFEIPGSDWVGRMLLLGLGAAGLLAASVSAILRLARRDVAHAGAGDARAAASAVKTVVPVASPGDSQPPLERILDQAKARGILPAEARLPEPESRPWPVVLLVALGAWLATLPLLSVVGLLLGPLLTTDVGASVAGVLLLIASVVVLRARELPVFVEQLAIPGLLTGGGTLAFGLGRGLGTQTTAAVLCLVALVIAAFVARPWLRVLLGALAATLFAFAVTPLRLFDRGSGHQVAWMALHFGLAAWAAALVIQSQVLADGRHAPFAAAVESIAAGWVLAVLAGLAVWAGMTMLVGGVMGGIGPQPGRYAVDQWPMRAASTVLGAAGLLLAGRHWPTLRQPAPALAGLVIASLAWFLPSLGGVLFALAALAITQRWLLAGAGALAAAWITGAFYYQLQWSLATKAVVLVGAGAALGAIGWLAQRTRRTVGATPDLVPMPWRWGRPLIALTAVLVAGVANFAIWQKETLIAHGDKVFVRLAPVDPRSLMQGDYMRLAFAVPGPMDAQMQSLVSLQRPHVAAVRAPNGVAELRRLLAPGESPGPGEMRIELTPKGGRWILVTDAWFFREGEAARFERARYGEFRVLPDGRALLVGLADEQLRTIPP